ncbi:MAG: hypothetical protein NT069_15840 [Planctomycetota bacterium]|nr:hypothetical protein [Planctomycetota bacterium]
MPFCSCVLFPAFVTAVAPVTWITLTREGGVVSGVARQCLFFVVPYQTQRISPVLSEETRFLAGEMVPNSNGPTIDERRRSHRTEDEGYLVLRGPNEQISVMVSPVDLERTRDSIEAFLEDPAARSKRWCVVANWKISVFVGGGVSLLTGLYLYGLVAGAASRLQTIWSKPSDSSVQSQSAQAQPGEPVNH